MKYFLLLLSILFLLNSCGENKVKPATDSSFKVEELPSQESWGSTIFFTDSGKTKAVLKAGHLRVFENSQQTLLDSGLKVDFYNDEQVKTTTLTSKRGRVNDATEDLYAMDSVVAVSDSGVTLKTEELEWRNKDKKIVSDKFVTITSKKEIIQGYGFVSDQHLQNYVINNITYVTRRENQK